MRKNGDDVWLLHRNSHVEFFFSFKANVLLLEEAIYGQYRSSNIYTLNLGLLPFQSHRGQIHLKGDTPPCPTGSELSGLGTTTKESCLQKAPGEVVSSNDGHISFRWAQICAWGSPDCFPVPRAKEVFITCHTVMREPIIYFTPMVSFTVTEYSLKSAWITLLDLVSMLSPFWTLLLIFKV